MRTGLFIYIIILISCGCTESDPSFDYEEDEDYYEVEDNDEGEDNWRPVEIITETNARDVYGVSAEEVLALSYVEQQRLLAYELIDKSIEMGPEPAFPNINPDEFYASLKQRIDNPKLFSQKNLLTCGPACLCFIMAAEEPLRFAHFALSLFHDGRDHNYLGGQEIVVPDEMWARAPGDSKWPEGKRVNDPVDWLVMCALLTSDLTEGTYEDPSDPIWEGSTRPGLLAKWLEGIYSDVENEASVVRSKPVDFMLEVDEKFRNGYHCPLLINSVMIDQSNISLFYNVPNHWVVYQGNLILTDDYIRFDIWTWGYVTTVDVPVEAFNKTFFGALFAGERRSASLNGLEPPIGD